MFDFSGKIAMITGAAGGIGVELCHYFLERGAIIYAFDKDEAGLAAIAHKRLHPATADLTDIDAVAASVAKLSSAHGAVDILINNVGAAAANALCNLTPEDWHHDIEINLSAAYHCVEAVKHPMIERGHGIIINIGSVNGSLALGHPAYSAAKAGLVSYTKSLAVEYGHHGIRANIVCPGTVKTQAWQARADKNPKIFDDLKKWYPLGDFPTGHDIAMAAGFLASDDARMITGVMLPVDAGLTAGNPVMAAELTLEKF